MTHDDTLRRAAELLRLYDGDDEGYELMLWVFFEYLEDYYEEIEK